MTTPTTAPAAKSILTGIIVRFRDHSAAIVEHDGKSVRLATLANRWVDDGTDKGTFAEVQTDDVRTMPARVLAEGIESGLWTVEAPAVPS